ncbi:uncharacterized protein LOC110246012 [Exaiptasia diaphana]|uniref:PH domain-containing protein n=1 Tax=Exaiptasia diaphana TaxID=2652724 RepID=A0A913XR62_EXADI|nr:uncharacterized protein LOC110246012 [Exaiptasia diaphana]
MLFCVLGLSEPKTVDSDEDTNFEEYPLFPSDAEATDAALVMLKKKMNGKYTLFKEPLSLNSCIVCKDSDHKDCFEIINMARETYVFKAGSIKESKKWLKHLRLQAKDLGAWKKRRNGLPNIMIKTI